MRKNNNTCFPRASFSFPSSGASLPFPSASVSCQRLHVYSHLLLVARGGESDVEQGREEPGQGWKEKEEVMERT
jgi:hypothetical protein